MYSILYSCTQVIKQIIPVTEKPGDTEKNNNQLPSNSTFYLLSQTCKIAAAPTASSIHVLAVFLKIRQSRMLDSIARFWGSYSEIARGDDAHSSRHGVARRSFQFQSAVGVDDHRRCILVHPLSLYEHAPASLSPTHEFK